MDGAGELRGAEITALMQRYNISPRYSEPYDANPDGRAEKSVELVVKYLRYVLHHSGRSSSVCPSPLRTNATALEDSVGVSPYTTYFPNSTNNVANFAIFGAFATVHVTKARMIDLNGGLQALKANARACETVQIHQRTGPERHCR